MAEFFHILSSGLGMALFFLAQLAAFVLIPLGLPGTWLQIIAAAILTLASDGAKMTWPWVGAFAGLAAVGEVVEFFSGQWGARRFGGSRLAAWGALAGGLAGLFLGGLIPIPLVGSVVMSFAGTFAGAMLGEMQEQKNAAPNLRVGCGAVLGRTLGVAAKMSIAFLIAALSAAVVVCKTAAP